MLSMLKYKDITKLFKNTDKNNDLKYQEHSSPVKKAVTLLVSTSTMVIVDIIELAVNWTVFLKHDPMKVSKKQINV